jgi:hypothetical protein
MPSRVIILGALTVVLLAAGCGPLLNDDTAASISFAGYIFVIALEILGEETKRSP